MSPLMGRMCAYSAFQKAKSKQYQILQNRSMILFKKRKAVTYPGWVEVTARGLRGGTRKRSFLGLNQKVGCWSELFRHVEFAPDKGAEDGERHARQGELVQDVVTSELKAQSALVPGSREGRRASVLAHPRDLGVNHLAVTGAREPLPHTVCCCAERAQC